MSSPPTSSSITEGLEATSPQNNYGAGYYTGNDHGDVGMSSSPDIQHGYPNVGANIIPSYETHGQLTPSTHVTPNIRLHPDPLINDYLNAVASSYVNQWLTTIPSQHTEPQSVHSNISPPTRPTSSTSDSKELNVAGSSSEVQANRRDYFKESRKRLTVAKDRLGTLLLETHGRPVNGTANLINAAVELINELQAKSN